MTFLEFAQGLAEIANTFKGEGVIGGLVLVLALFIEGVKQTV